MYKRYCKKFNSEVGYPECIICNEKKPCQFIEVEEPDPEPDFELYNDYK